MPPNGFASRVRPTAQHRSVCKKGPFLHLPMKMLDKILKDVAIDDSDAVARYVAYGARRKGIRRGEFPHLHVLFEPIISEPIESVSITRQTEDNRGIRAELPLLDIPLPQGYGRFLCETNGGLFFGGNVILFGLPDLRDIPNDYVVKYRSPNIVPPNILARPAQLKEGDVQLGAYFFSSRLLVYDRNSRVVCLTKPFSREVQRSWETFDDYVSECLYSYRDYFDGNWWPLGNSPRDF